MTNKIIWAIVICLVLWLILSCGGDKSLQELREDFEKDMTNNFAVMLPKDIAQCAAKALSKYLSDEEIALMMGSFTDRVSNPEKGMALQQKLQSRQFLKRFIDECQ